MPRYAFAEAQLDDQLDRAARRFVAEKRNVRVDRPAQIIFLSSIFDWYRTDFIKSYQSQFPGREATLPDYIALYSAPEQANELRSSSFYKVRFVPYDWRLNDQKLGD